MWSFLFLPFIFLWQTAVLKLDSGAVLYAYPPETSAVVTDSVRCFRKLDAREIVSPVLHIPPVISSAATSTSVAVNNGFLATLLGKVSVGFIVLWCIYYLLQIMFHHVIYRLTTISLSGPATYLEKQKY